MLAYKIQSGIDGGDERTTHPNVRPVHPFCKRTTEGSTTLCRDDWTRAMVSGLRFLPWSCGRFEGPNWLAEMTQRMMMYQILYM